MIHENKKPFSPGYLCLSDKTVDDIEAQLEEGGKNGK